MDNIKENLRKPFNNEEGIAIILVLGFMAIILVLVLSFLDTSIINKKISENYSYLQSARMAAQTANHRALAIIDSYRGDSSKDMMKLFSYDTNKSNDDLDKLLVTIVDGVTYFSDYNPDDGPHWQYLPNDYDTDTPITARIAFAVIVDIGKLDPSVAIDSGYNAQIHSKYAVSEKDYSKTGTNSNGTYVIGRPGREISEIYLTSLPSWFTVNNAKDMSVTNANPAGNLAIGERWDSFDTIFNELGISDEITKDSFRNVFVLNNLPDAEAFWIDNGDLQRESSELYHRFNLARTDWSQIEVDSILSTPEKFDENTPASDIYSIYWLKNWESNGGFEDAETCSRQIAANLIDYCDSDDSATADDVDSPAYVGLEKVPYINEIKLSFQSKIEEEDQTPANPFDDAPPYSYMAEVKVNNVELELINIYDNSKNVTAEVYLDLTYEWSYNGSNGIFQSGMVNSFLNPVSDVSLNFNTSSKSYSIESSINPAGFDFSSQWTSGAELSSTHATDKKIENLTVNSLKIKLKDTTDNFFYDYAFVLKEPTILGNLTTDGNDFYFYFDSQVTDPRQNLLSTDWSYETDTNLYGTPSLIGTLISPYINDNSDPKTGSDSEIVDDPIDVSTAFIRNAPMQSPWELGFIHRGFAFQTINLKKYRETSLIGYGGGSSYSDGDANILDQVKMTSENTIYGKINLNTNIKDVLIVLLDEICVGSNIENPGEITANYIDADLLSDSIMAKNGVNDGYIFHTRAQVLREAGVASFCNDSLGLLQNTDAKQEEAIGKFINLTKAAYPDFYTIVIVAQAIKDISAVGTYEVGVDKILATQKILTTIQWDEQEQEYRIVKYEYLD